MHELVVRLSLNGRAWGGEFTRPWVLAGRGMGAAVAVAYAAQHKVSQPYPEPSPEP